MSKSKTTNTEITMDELHNEPLETRTDSSDLKVSAVRIMDIKGRALLYITIENGGKGEKVIINVGETSYKGVRNLIATNH